MKPTLAEPRRGPRAAVRLRNWQLLAPFRTALGRAVRRRPLPPTWADPRRRAALADHLGLLLFGLLNPGLKSQRALSAASGLARVQAEVCGTRLSHSTLSEAQHSFDPELLAEVFARLCARLPAAPRADAPLAWLAGWEARDSTVLRALPRMAWARYGGGRPGPRPARAVRLHLDLRLHDGTPQGAQVTPAATGERAVWAAHLRPGARVVADRGYGQSLRQLAALDAQGVGYVVRLRAGVARHGVAELPVSAADRAAGVVSDQWVTLGQRRQARVRVVRVRPAARQEELLLATDLGPEVLRGELVSRLYRQRWQVELFFRWFKCVLGAGRHWPWESPGGVAAQLYLALIAAVLLAQRLGRRPRQREWELLQLYFLGWVSPVELRARLAGVAAARAQA